MREFFEKYRERIGTIALFSGFFIDAFTLTRIDRLYDNVVLFLYLCIVGLGIILINVIESGRLKGKIFKNIHAFLPTVVQFAFGGIFSGFSIFYFKSSSFGINIIFAAILFGLMIGNEFLKEKYKKIIFQVSFFYFALFSYLIFSVPVFSSKLGAGVFLISGAFSLIGIYLFIMIIRTFLPVKFKETKSSLYKIIGGIFIVMNILYFANIIPPIPLSIKQIDTYHFVERDGSDYYVLEEVLPWYSVFDPRDVVHITEGESVYVFSSVFSPTDLNTNVVHNWQYFDEGTDKWVSLGKIYFSIVGGRDGGYRGYTKKSNVFSGRWRVDVETERGQVIGRDTFSIEVVPEKVLLQEVKI
ncbi:MAG: DUF2914 domain-containing protein [Candidatus Pacebacteria bacterium]|nr:DUF2914 domain-containing protein [Candidatus Paceibacterota bacterium]